MVSCLCTVDPGHGNHDRYLFPSRMPAYELNWWYSLYFITYIIINTYLFMSVFLAVVYNNYRKHLKVTRLTWGPAGVSRLAGVGAGRPACAFAKYLSVLIFLLLWWIWRFICLAELCWARWFFVSLARVWQCISASGQILYLLLTLFFFSFWPGHLACVILVPNQGLSPVVERQSLNCWTTREIPCPSLLTHLIVHGSLKSFLLFLRVFIYLFLNFYLLSIKINYLF